MTAREAYPPGRHRRPPGRPPVTGDEQAAGTGAERVLELQRTAGNRAVCRLIGGSATEVQRKHTTADEAAARADAAEAHAEAAATRADAAGARADAAGQQAQQASRQAGGAMARANAAMDETKLASLRTVAAGRVNLAYTAYISACKDVRDAIRSTAKQNAEAMALVLDVAMGFATPGLARWIVGFANRIPVESTTLAYRIALAAIDSDQVKAALTGATKTACQTLKFNSMALAGETDVDAFIGALETRTQQAFQLVIDGLPGRSAVEVGAVASAFDWSVANHEVYRREIENLCHLFERDVSPIGEPTMSETFPAQAVWVRDGGARRLAIVTYQPGLLGLVGNKYFLDSWVDPQLQELAVGKQMAKHHRIETIDKTELRGLR